MEALDSSVLVLHCRGHCNIINIIGAWVVEVVVGIN